MTESWESATVEISTVDWKGVTVTLHDVPAKRNIATGKVRVSPTDVAKAEIVQVARELKLEERDVPLFLLLYAKPGPFQRGYLCEKYKMNKMLFYLWKELEREGLGDALPHDEFVADKRGPVPKNLYEDFERLAARGLFQVKGGRGTGKPVTCAFTPEGERLATRLWGRLADPYLVAASRVKDWLFPLNCETIMKRVHREYPHLRKTYTQPDAE